MKKSLSILALATLGIMASSCTKQSKISDEKPDFNNAETTHDLEVPSSFDWKTTNEIEVVITPSGSGVMEIRDNEHYIYQKAFVKAGETFTTVISVPLAKDQVQIFLNGKSEVISSSAQYHNSQL